VDLLSVTLRNELLENLEVDWTEILELRHLVVLSLLGHVLHKL